MKYINTGHISIERKRLNLILQLSSYRYFENEQGHFAIPFYPQYLPSCFLSWMFSFFEISPNVSLIRVTGFIMGSFTTVKVFHRDTLTRPWHFPANSQTAIVIKTKVQTKEGNQDLKTGLLLKGLVYDRPNLPI